MALPPEAADSNKPAVVMTGGGVVTLLDLPQLRARIASLQSQAASLTSESRALRALAEGLWAQRGAALLERLADWAASPQLADLVRQAAALKDREGADDARLKSIQGEEHHGVTGLIGKVGDWSESRKTAADRTKADSQLRPLLIQIGYQAPEVTVPDANLIRKQAIAAMNEAQALESQAGGIGAAAALATDELKRRSDAEREMGFDAPYLAATLRTYGPRAVESPLILKKGEQACMTVAATLARQQTRRQWVGGSQGFSFPI